MASPDAVVTASDARSPDISGISQRGAGAVDQEDVVELILADHRNSGAPSGRSGRSCWLAGGDPSTLEALIGRARQDGRLG